VLVPFSLVAAGWVLAWQAPWEVRLQKALVRFLEERFPVQLPRLTRWELAGVLERNSGVVEKDNE
jgi:hypothetical protein